MPVLSVIFFYVSQIKNNSGFVCYKHENYHIALYAEILKYNCFASTVVV